MMMEHNDNKTNSLIQRDSSGLIVPKINHWNSKNRRKKNMHQVYTVSLTCRKSLNLDALNQWISILLQERGEKIYRFKGILNIDNFDHQFVLQGVHMIFDGEIGPLWEIESSERLSKLVFIGLDLDKEKLEEEFLSCQIK
jgi:G3E family GTPase